MAAQGNAAPILIKRKKIINGGGHHGGAWKVAYADFVTAMMAFFMLMWLLNATTEKQRKGIADFFNPTIPVNRISGGGNGAFGGDSVTSEQTLAQNGTGASATAPTADQQARGELGQSTGQSAETEALQALEQALLARSGESMTMERLMRHVITRVSDEGLIVELFDLPDAPLFTGDGADLTNGAQQVVAMVADVFALATNEVAVNGHVKSYPAPLRDNPVWSLSAARAESVRQALQGAGLDAQRLQRVTGFADRKPVTANPTAARNNRIEVILLRSSR
ncbi:MAG: chemotaxis protein MotB [Rhodobacteraceae bacterium PARR1]|nr:MAG: chemotaxis protein MotB [Rhodobacteraceae bacterium PARR1]